MTLLLLHPIGLDSRTWDLLPSSILDRAETYDMPGHGGRAYDGLPMSLDTMGATISA